MMVLVLVGLRSNVLPFSADVVVSLATDLSPIMKLYVVKPRFTENCCAAKNNQTDVM